MVAIKIVYIFPSFIFIYTHTQTHTYIVILKYYDN